jgi:dTDP-4-dehydrorhamnose 3,5-epimerase
MTPKIVDYNEIDGVQIADLAAFGDERGRFSEIFRREWFPQREWHSVQLNRSDSAAGVLRGLHYHFRQVDYWYLVAGSVRVGLADLRPSSPTYLGAATIELKASDNRGLFIPVGVAHGFLALSDVTLIYVVDNYYDGTDEFGLAWNDPDLAVPWRTAQPPTLSGRDSANPYLQDIAAAQLPSG